MKTEIIAGDTLDFETTIAGYPSGDGWTLSYRLLPRTTGTAIDFSAASAQGETYRVQVANGTTADWAPGEYSWFAYIEKSGQRLTVDAGDVTILEDPKQAATYDRRSFARKVLDAIEAALVNKATKAQLDIIQYQIGNRGVQKDKATLITLRDKFKWEVANEDARAKIAAGLGNPRNVGIRFGR